MRKERAMELRRINMLNAQSVSDDFALTVPSLFPMWQVDTPYGGEGEIKIVKWEVNGQEYLYRCKSPHTSQAGWEPNNVPALWVAITISEEEGTKDNPILATRGMEYIYGKYYKDPEDNNVYLCKRIGEEEGGTIELQYLPHELIGHYFELA